MWSRKMNGPTSRRRAEGSARRTLSSPRSFTVGSTTRSTGPGPAAETDGSAAGSQLMAVGASGERDAETGLPPLAGRDQPQTRLVAERPVEADRARGAVPRLDAQEVGAGLHPQAELPETVPSHLDRRAARRREPH